MKHIIKNYCNTVVCIYSKPNCPFGDYAQYDIDDTGLCIRCTYEGDCELKRKEIEIDFEINKEN